MLKIYEFLRENDNYFLEWVKCDWVGSFWFFKWFKEIILGGL